MSKDGAVAQSVEQRPEKPRVAGSIPACATIFGALAHLVEHLPFKQVVPGSNPGRLIFV